MEWECASNQAINLKIKKIFENNQFEIENTDNRIDICIIKRKNRNFNGSVIHFN